MLLALLISIPWVLTVIGLLIIISKRKKEETEEIQEENIIDDGQEIVRVAIYDEKAYWVHDNTFFEAEVVREPDFSTAKPIDTMSLSPKQLNELLLILDGLSEDGKE